MGLLKSIKKRFYRNFFTKKFAESQFYDIKWKVDFYGKVLSQQTSGARLDSFQRLTVLTSADRIENIAFISILPPETSGIATSSLYSFVDCEDQPIDLFTIPVDDESYFVNKHILSNNSTANLYHLDAFILANLKRNYRKIIIAIGNSNHHFYIWDFLKKLKVNGLMDRVVIYVHDFFLHNIMYDGRRVEHVEDYAREIGASYLLAENEIKELIKKKDKWKLQKEIIDKRISGLRIFQSMGVNDFLVNSKTAYELVKNDLDKSLQPVVSRIFLPVLDNSKLKFSEKEILTKEPGILYLGTFGVVSDAKCVRELINAVYDMNLHGVPTKLVIAGWHANEYIKRIDQKFHQYIILFDSPSDNDLLSLMKSVDWAIQLRRFNGGESSGIVPMLLQSEVPTIVSKVGSFNEFGDAVYFFDNIELPTLSKFILKTVKCNNLHDLKKSMARYVEKHSPEQFCKELKRIY